MRVVCEEVVDDSWVLADDVSAFAVFVDKMDGSTSMQASSMMFSTVKPKSRAIVTQMKRACDRSKRKSNAVG
jgi:hypothetical protein